MYSLLRASHLLDETSQTQAYLAWMRSSYASSHRASQLLVVSSCICPSHIASQLLDVKSLSYASSHRANHLLDVKSCIGLSHRASQLLDVRSLAYASSHRASHLLDVKFLHMTFNSGSQYPIGPALFHVGCGLHRTNHFSCWMWIILSICNASLPLTRDYTKHLSKVPKLYFS